MATNDSDGERPAPWRILGAASMVAAFLVWLIPVLMLPFVNVLPYLHSIPTSQRVAISAAFFLVACVIGRTSMTKEQWQTVRAVSFSSWKAAAGVLLGVLMATYAAGALSANTFGLLARAFPSREVILELVVSKSSGSRFKAVDLELSSPSDRRHYQITLSKRVFDDLLSFKQGDVIRFEAVEGPFGVYVTNFSVKN